MQIYSVSPPVVFHRSEEGGCLPATGTMPEFISVNEYISEVKDDISSPPTSNFISKMPLCRQTVNELEEVRTLVAYSVTCPDASGRGVMGWAGGGGVACVSGRAWGLVDTLLCWESSGGRAGQLRACPVVV